jgi:hypothetical protein
MTNQTATEATVPDALCAELHRRAEHLQVMGHGSARDQVYGETLGLRGAIGIALGERVPGGSADAVGFDYYQAWCARQEVRT